MLVRSCSLFSIWLLFGALSLASAADSVEVKLTLRSRRVVQGVVDAATNDETVWLRTAVGNASVRRPVAVTAIEKVEINEQGAEIAALRPLAAQDAGLVTAPPVTRRQVQPGMIVILNPLPRQPADVPANAQPNIPVAVRVDAVTANWNADAAHDGLLVFMTPLDSDGRAVAVNGSAEIEWWGAQAASRVQTPVGRAQHRPVRWGYWTEELTTQNYQTGYRLRLPFQTLNPQQQQLLSNYSLVRVRLHVPGVGDFTGETDGVRVQPWQPLVDFTKG